MSTIPSATRRSFHLIEMARAHDQRREPVATLHLLNQAHTEAPETVRFNLFTRQALPSLAKHGPVSIRSEAAELAGALGIAS